MKKNLGRILTLLLFFGVSYFLYKNLSGIKFEEVVQGFKNIGFRVVGITLILAMANFFILTSFDYLGFRTLNLTFMKYPKVLLSSFICYVLTLNAGAIFGGIGLRYKIYSGWAVPLKNIPYIILFSVISNWSGYVFLLGLISIFQRDRIGRLFQIPSYWVLGSGLVAMGVVLLYFVLCGIGFKKNIRNAEFQFPKISTALLQLILSIAQWSILSLIIYIFLRELGPKVLFSEVLFTLLLSGIAGVITHIPAGIGVMESVFLEVGPRIRPSHILTALICFRAVYYFIPLMIALPSYFYLRRSQKRLT